jgi:phosphoglycolate phosphatase-like HAD superfamily hydrolase
VVDPDAIATLFRLQQRGKSLFLISKNPDPSAAIARAKIPDLFIEVVRTEDKVAAVSKLAERHGLALNRTLMINDSGAERLLFERALPEVRTIAPDALQVLG